MIAISLLYISDFCTKLAFPDNELTLGAMKKCRECGLLVSTDAKACPHCGKPKPTTNPTSGGPVAIVLIVGAVWFVYHEATKTPEQARLERIETERRKEEDRRKRRVLTFC